MTVFGMDSGQSINGTRETGVTVVIPAYNYARFLSKAIDSVLRQECLPQEIIVVDDGSTDNTPDVAAQYGDRIRYIRKENGGLPAARNTGIKAARCGLIAFLDADDEWDPSFLRKILEQFGRLTPDYCLVASACRCVDKDGKPMDKKWIFPAFDREVTGEEILLQTRFSPSAVVARRQTIEDCGGFDETLRSSEDRDMWLRMSARGKIFVLNDRLLMLRKHADNMSRRADRMKENVRRVLVKAWKNRLVPHRRIFLWLKVFSFHYFQSAWVYHDECRCWRAAREMCISILLWPWWMNPGQYNEPVFFRLRSLWLFCGVCRRMQTSDGI